MNRNENIIKALALITAFLLILCIIGLFILASMPSDQQDSGQQPPDSGSNPPDRPAITIDNVTLPLAENAGDEYLNKIYFVGDSTTWHFHKGGVDTSHLLVPSSLTLMLTSDILTIPVTDAQVSIPQALKNANAEIVIITVGVNGADSFSEISYKTFYKKLIQGIKETSPNTKIILQSVFPVEYDFSESNKGITNAGIDRLNGWAKEIATDCSVRYLDTCSILKGENGAMIPKYSEGDGVHMNASAYQAIIEYIKTHPID